MKKLILFSLSLLIIVASPISAQEKRSQIREEVRTNIATSSAKRTEVKERVQTRIEEFKAKMAQIKDERKQKIAVRVNTQLAHLNQQITTNLSHLLTRLRALMDKLSSRIEVAKTEGLDTTKAEAAMITASALIVKAETAVQAQALNDYTIVFSDESGLKVGASAAKLKLKTDLKAVKELVKEARQAVVDVLQELEVLYQ